MQADQQGKRVREAVTQSQSSLILAMGVELSLGVGGVATGRVCLASRHLARNE